MDDYIGYTFGSSLPDGKGEPARMEVCTHGNPLGWSCVGCAKDLIPPKFGTAPAHRATPPRFVLRAVCDHCGSRVWLEERRKEIR